MFQSLDEILLHYLAWRFLLLILSAAKVRADGCALLPRTAVSKTTITAGAKILSD